MAGLICPTCGAGNEAGQWACSACHTSFAATFDRSRRPKVCPVCRGATMTGTAQLRLSGATGMGVLFAGGLPDSGMMFLPIETETCTSCGHMDLYRG